MAKESDRWGGFVRNPPPLSDETPPTCHFTSLQSCQAQLAVLTRRLCCSRDFECAWLRMRTMQTVATSNNCGNKQHCSVPSCNVTRRNLQWSAYQAICCLRDFECAQCDLWQQATATRQTGDLLLARLRMRTMQHAATSNSCSESNQISETLGKPMVWGHMGSKPLENIPFPACQHCNQ